MVARTAYLTADTLSAKPKRFVRASAASTDSQSMLSEGTAVTTQQSTSQKPSRFPMCPVAGALYCGASRKFSPRSV